MNNFIRNKFVAASLAFVLAISLVSLPLPARERRGSDVVVTLTDGSKIKGEMLAVKTDALLVFDRAAHQGKSIDLGQIARVKVLKTFWGLTGIVFGLGAGTGLLTLIPPSRSNFYVNEMKGRLKVMMIFTLAGGVFGAFKSVPTKITLAGESSLSVQQNLEKLRRYAREKGFAEPVDSENVENLK